MRRILFAALVIAACTNDATGPSALGLSFSVMSGDGQSGVVGQPLQNPVVIKATDSRGRPQKNLQVSFVITSGGGSANPASARTDQNGLAQASWTLGTSVAQAQGLEARAGSTVLGAFTATPLAGPVSQLAIEAGDNQSAIHDATVGVAPAVEDVLDHVDVCAGWDGLHEVCGDQLAAVCCCFGIFGILGEAGFGVFYAGFEIYEHAGQVGILFEDGEEERASSAAEVGYYLGVGEVPGLGDGGVVFCGGGAHDGAEDGAGVWVLRPAGGDVGVADLGGGLAGADAVGEEGPAVGEQVGPEDYGGPCGLGHVFSQWAAEVGEAEIARGGFFGDSDAGEGAQQAVEGVWVGLAGFGEGIDVAGLVAECIRDAEAGCGAEHAAAGVAHGHFDQAGVGCNVADVAAGWSHEAPRIQCTRRRGNCSWQLGTIA